MNLARLIIYYNLAVQPAFLPYLNESESTNATTSVDANATTNATDAKPSDAKYPNATIRIAVIRLEP